LRRGRRQAGERPSLPAIEPRRARAGERARSASRRAAPASLARPAGSPPRAGSIWTRARGLLRHGRVSKTDPIIAVLSDQRLFRQGTAQLLRTQGFTDVTEHESRDALLAAARTRVPDIAIIDLDHARDDTMTLVRTLRRELPRAHVVVIGSALRQGAANETVDAGVETPEGGEAELAAAALTPRQRRQSAEALRQHLLWSRITPRQRDVLRWLAVGADNQSIARQLRIGERAVKSHVSTLLHTFAADNRTQLALLADHAGLRPPRVGAHDLPFGT
jgi:DNA-binding NarL/FixJ family response regulator